MEQAIGDLLPSAIGVALSPIPIIAVVLMLGTRRARADGLAFAAGWVVGLAGVSAVVLVVSGGADDADSGASTAASVVQLLLGVLFLAMALRQWRGRPRPGQEPEMPGWMAAIDELEPAKALGLGVLLSAANPKNLALTVAAATTLAEAGLSSGEDVVAIGVFVLLGSVTVVGPVLLYVFGGDRASRPLASIKEFMSDNNAAIMIVLLLVLGAKLIGSGIAGLTD